jgi:hypothetical protein
MAIKSNKTLGFTLIEASLAIVTVFILAGLSFAVYQHNKTQTTNAAPNTSQINNGGATTKPAAPTVTYLTVKEWGVKLPLDNTVKDAYYVIDPSSWKNPDGLPSTAFLGVKSLSSTSCNPTNNTEGKKGAIGAILRVPSGQADLVTGQPIAQEYPNGITVNGYYYTYQSWTSNNPCASQNTLQPYDSAFATNTKSTAQASTN